MRSLKYAALALIAAVALGAAQEPPQQPPPPQPPPTFKAESSLVRVDVTVVDRRGDPAPNLSADDFTIDEDGVKQTVESFKFVSADGQPPREDDRSLTIRSPEHAAAEASRDDVRVFLIFWDEYHIGKFVQAIQGRKALHEFVTSAFGPTDLVALMDPLLPVDAIRFTRDRAELASRIQKLEGRYGVYTPTRSAAEDAQAARGDVARIRSEVTMSAVRSAAVHLGSLKEGRKAIVLVSEGLAGLTFDERAREIQELTDAANNNNVAIYTLDPRGLVGGYDDALASIAENTGGHAFLNTNTPGKALLQVVKDASAFYLLGYSSSRSPRDGRFHKIRVRVKRSGLDVRARRGYWAPSDTDVARAKTLAAAAEAMPADVTGALGRLSAARPEQTMDLWIGAARGADARPAITVAWTPRPQPGQSSAARSATVAVTAKDADGEHSYEAPLDAGRVTFSAPPGALQLRTTVSGADGTLIDEDRRSAMVPDYSRAALSISSPVLLRARSAVEAKALAAIGQPLPYAGHDFVRTDRVFVRFAVYGTDAPQAEISAQLLSRQGSPLAKLTVSPRARASGEYEVDYPLASTARGDFLIAVEAKKGDDHARALVPLRVVP